MKKLFVVREIGKVINEEYHMMMTNEEMTTYLKALFAPKHSFPPVFQRVFRSKKPYSIIFYIGGITMVFLFVASLFFFGSACFGIVFSFLFYRFCGGKKSFLWWIRSL